MRSVNNLLEKFHQSFFLYLLCRPRGIRFSNLGATEGSVSKRVVTKNDDESMLLDIKTTKENAGRWRHAILVVSAVQLWAFIIALFPPVASSAVDMLETSLASTGITAVGGLNSASLKMSLWAFVAVLSLFVVLTSLPIAKVGDWIAVKALVLGVATIGLVVMSQVDFAVSLIGAVVLVPICLCPSPLRDMWQSST